jgi:tetratricopeptide (TPR) repeat protein
MYSIDVPPLALMGWVALGGIAAALDGGFERDVDESAASKAQPWLVGGLVVILALVAISLGVGPLRADYQAHSAQNRVSLGWSADALNMFTRAIALDPREGAYRGLAGSYLERVAEDDNLPFTRETALRRAAEFYEEAIELQPRNIYFMINAARVYARLGPEDPRYFSDADSWLSEVVARDPFNPQNHDLYANLLEVWAENTDDDEEADDLEERAKDQREIALAIRQGRARR